MAKEKSPPAAKKAPARKAPTRRSKATGAPMEAMIAERAYYLHLEGGSDPLANWVRAERELAAVA